MFEMIMNAGIGVHIVWAIGLLGLLLKMISNAYVKSIMKASDNMATTRKKPLRIIRQKYENRVNLGMGGASADSFVEKNVRRIKCGLMPIVCTRRTTNLGILSIIMVTAGAFLFYDVKWRGSPQMINLIINSIVICAFLLALENIFLTTNKVEILKANILDYLENMNGSMESVKRRTGYYDMHNDAERMKDTAVTEAAATRDIKEKAENTCAKAAAPREKDDSIESFLKEFFSEKQNCS